MNQAGRSVATGECELVDGKVGGITVHIGARVAKEAQTAIATAAAPPALLAASERCACPPSEMVVLHVRNPALLTRALIAARSRG
jgi:hypothetical protein